MGLKPNFLISLLLHRYLSLTHTHTIILVACKNHHYNHFYLSIKVEKHCVCESRGLNSIVKHNFKGLWDLGWINMTKFGFSWDPYCFGLIGRHDMFNYLNTFSVNHAPHNAHILMDLEDLGSCSLPRWPTPLFTYLKTSIIATLLNVIASTKFGALLIWRKDICGPITSSQSQSLGCP